MICISFILDKKLVCVQQLKNYVIAPKNFLLINLM